MSVLAASYQHVHAVGADYAHQECSYGSDNKSCIFKRIWHDQNSSSYVSLRQMDHCIHISENKIENEIHTFLIKYTRIIQENECGLYITISSDLWCY